MTNPDGQSGTLANGFSVTTPMPDLVPLTFNPPSGAVARTFTIQNAVKNIGTAAAGPFYAGFYLSADTTITISDTLIGTRSYSSGLGAGVAGANEDTSVIIPSSVPAGTYYLGMILDTANAVAESSENNNVASSTVPVTILAAPPTIRSIAPNTGAAGSTVAVTNLDGTGFLPGATVKLDSRRVC